MPKRRSQSDSPPGALHHYDDSVLLRLLQLLPAELRISELELADRLLFFFGLRFLLFPLPSSHNTPTNRPTILCCSRAVLWCSHSTSQTVFFPL